MQFLVNGFDQNDQTGNFNTASGTAGTGAHKHQHYKNCSGNLRPEIKICGGITCSSNNRAYLECGLLKRFRETRVHILDVKGDHQYGNCDDTQVAAHL